MRGIGVLTAGGVRAAAPGAGVVTGERVAKGVAEGVAEGVA
jgi:hypothetical protein